MKNFLIVLLIAIATVILAGESVTVGTNSVVILPVRINGIHAEWVGNTNAYAVGQYLSYRGKNYIVTTAGTATNNPPTHSSGIAAYDGVSYRHIKPGLRKSAVICNDSTNTVYLAEEGEAAIANKGIRLNANGGSYTIDADAQFEVTAIAASTNNNLTVQDR